MPSPDMMQVMQDLTSFTLLKNGSLIMQGPSIRQIKRRFELMGGANLWREPNDAMCSAYNEWIRTMLVTIRQGGQSRRAIAPAPGPSVERGGGPTFVSDGPMTWEARIKTMKYPDLLVLCRANAVQFIEESPNPGIRVMRARNALYARLRNGIKLTEPK